MDFHWIEKWSNDNISVEAGLSIILGIISLLIALITVNQSNKMIEEQTRPYITIHGQKTYLGLAKYFIIIKNYGTTAATIIKFDFDSTIKDYILLHNYNPFEHIVNTTLAPGQSVFIELDLSKLKGKNLVFEFDIKYKAIKKYKEKIILNVEGEIENTIAHTHAYEKDGFGNQLTEIEKLTKEIEILNDTINGIAEELIKK